MTAGVKKESLKSGKSAKESSAFSLGTALGFVALPEDVSSLARQTSDAFWTSQVNSRFDDQVETMECGDMDQAWIPHGPLRALGYRVDTDHQQWIMTTGVDPHIDDDYGMVLVWVIHNDGMYFKQGRSKNVIEAGQWLIFNDCVLHSVDSVTSQSSGVKKSVFISWNLKIIKI